MNLLYFDETELWTPKIDDLDDEFDISVEDEEYHSINKNQTAQGKWLNLWATPIAFPNECIPIHIAEE